MGRGISLGLEAVDALAYQQVLRSQLTPAFGELRVTAVTESAARQMMTKLQDAGMGPRRINLVLLVLKQIVRTAWSRRLLRDDPLVAVKLLREPATEVDPLAPDEVAAFLRACPACWRPYFTVALWTGARPNELAALKWATWYDTRHSFASNALATGESPSWVAAQLGHATAEMLFNVYARFIPNRTRRDGSALLARMADTTPAKSDTGNLRGGEQHAQ